MEITRLCEDDCYIVRNILSHTLQEKCLNISLFENEMNWGRLSHNGKESSRQVAIQGSMNEFNDIPLYRTPNDYMIPLTPWTETVHEIKTELNEFFQTSFNHCKLQLYQNGNDSITKHSDKTLDIERGSNIVNLNIGTTRCFTLQNKQTNETINVQFVHNSVIVLGWKTNIKWTHCVKKQSNLNESRISLVFRNISTWLTEEGIIYGQGGRFKTREEAVTHSQQKQQRKQSYTEIERKICEEHEQERQKEESQRMLAAFSEENRQTEEEFWERIYGEGFDVCDLHALLTNR